MVNPGAAKHLALVVGVLLCFFVYMGYHLKTRQAEPDGEHAGLASADADSAVAVPVATENDRPAVSRDDQSATSTTALPIPTETTRQPAPSAPKEGALSLAEGLFDLSGADDKAVTAPPGSAGEEDNVITGLTNDVPSLTVPGQTAETPAAGPDPQSGTAASAQPEIAAPAHEISGLRPPPAQSEPPAPAGSVESMLAEAQPSRPQPPSSPPAPPSPPAPARQPAEAARNDAPPPAAPSQRQLPPAEGPGGQSGQLRSYTIRPGDTLSSIASRELGSISLADNIYLMNRDVIFDPDFLMVGAQIKLPPLRSAAAETERPAPPAARPAAGGPPPPRPPGQPRPQDGDGTASADGRRYVIRPGDTLSSIALRFYGSSSGWRFLYDSNRQVISNPNQLTVGVEISIPPYGER